jgi:multimeric flavodoxin WrbA
MHILGISCGSPNGNSEILLKAALEAAVASATGTSISIIRLNELSCPSFPIPGAFDPGRGAAFGPPKKLLPHDKIPDDRLAALNAILDADAIILASPVYTRQPAGVLKYFFDKTLGPTVDASFVLQALEGKKAGNPRFKDYSPDTRVLKPRIAGLIAVGGAGSPEWGTFALPLLHQCVFSFHAKVVDQIQIYQCPFPGSVLLRDESNAMEQAERLGRNIAANLGRSFEQAKYMGENHGSCPYCHLDMVVLNGTEDNGIDCAVCGAKGNLQANADGKIMAVMNAEPVTSIITMEGKGRHMQEIEAVGRKLGPKMANETVQAERARYKDMDESLILRLPSSEVA